jgi:hypothetical protein
MDGGASRVDFDDDRDVNPEERGRALPDLLRKMMALGLSGFFTTEAAIRGALGETVPREWIDFLSEQSGRTREELAKRLAAEFGRVLEDVDLVELAEELLADRTIEVKAEIRLGRRTPGPEGKPPRRTP